MGLQFQAVTRRRLGFEKRRLEKRYYIGKPNTSLQKAGVAYASANPDTTIASSTAVQVCFVQFSRVMRRVCQNGWRAYLAWLVIELIPVPLEVSPSSSCDWFDGRNKVFFLAKKRFVSSLDTRTPKVVAGTTAPMMAEPSPPRV